ncbi:hypothetical protein CRM89_23850 [Nocardia sp. FDAARGOS_372]|nr:hypothetical protein CRM89_23850 [Nocardia sp. FDAARGOS_372]
MTPLRFFGSSSLPIRTSPLALTRTTFPLVRSVPAAKSMSGHTSPSIWLRRSPAPARTVTQSARSAFAQYSATVGGVYDFTGLPRVRSARDSLRGQGPFRTAHGGQDRAHSSTVTSRGPPVRPLAAMFCTSWFPVPDSP